MSNNSLPDIPSTEAVEALLAQPNTRVPTGARNRAMLELMAHGGLRVAEVCDLKPGHIDWKEGQVMVKNGKGGRDRVVPLHPQTMAWLQLWNEKRPKHSKYFFVTIKRFHLAEKAGGKLTTRYLDQLVKKCADDARVQRTEERESSSRLKYLVHCHSLRHFYATEMLKICTLPEVQQILGHSNVSVTSIYLHVDPRELRAKIQGQPTREEREAKAAEVAAAMDVLTKYTRESLPTE